MKNKRCFLILLAVIALLTVSAASAFGQEIDVDNMDNEQLTTLLMQILNKLQQEEEPAPETDPEVQETPAPTAASVPEVDPEAIEEVIQITIYENKKLMVEALPGYMFIQPTREPKQDSNGGQTEHYPGEICDYDSLACDMVDGIPVNCHPYRTWELVDGVWMCPSG